MDKRIKDGKKEWKCDRCGQWFELDEEWSKEGAIEECKELWGLEPDNDTSAVCDDCWEEIHPSKHIDLYEWAKRTIEEIRKCNDKKVSCEDYMIMRKQKTIKWEFVAPFVTPFGMGGGNYVYNIGESYFSYNATPDDDMLSQILGIDDGEETAFYDEKEKGFVILLGDFRDEISERKINTWKKAMDFCKEKYPKYGAEFTTTHKDFDNLFNRKEE